MSIEYSVQLLLADILQFHSDLEGSEIPVGEGVRDIALLEAAVNAPFQTFGAKIYSLLCMKKLRGFAMG
ncbi:hypothetical protein [Schwartzia sp. (in: firmicutes)]